MIDMPEYSEQQLGQVRLGMTGVRRPRGRPRIVNPSDHKGAIRGAHQGTIDRFKKVCAEAGLDPAKELEKLLLQRIEELAGPEALKQMVSEMMAKKLGIEERITFLTDRINTLEKLNSAGPPDGVPYDGALEREVERLSTGENVYNYLGVLDDVSRQLSRQYPGHHWQTIKRELKGKIEERLPKKPDNRGE